MTSTAESSTGLSPELELRKLRPANLCSLARILDNSDAWQKLMQVVVKEGTENTPRFNSDHFSLVKTAGYQQRRSAAEIFLEEWSTMGRQRPTLKSTLELLVKAQLIRAADYIAVDLLRGEPSERPKSGPAAEIDIPIDDLTRFLDEDFADSKSLDSVAVESNGRLESALDRIDYPSGLDASDQQQNRATSAGAQWCTDPQFHEEMANLSLPASENRNCSDLIKFSVDQVTSERIHVRSMPTDHNSRVNLDVQNEHRGYDDRIAVLSSEQNNRTVHELESSELPVFVADIGKTSMFGHAELNSNELPQFVIDIAHQDSQQQLSTTVKSSETISSSNSTSTTESSDLSSQMQSFSTEPSTNITTNEDSNSRYYNRELLSCELPQFIADLTCATGEQSD